MLMAWLSGSSTRNCSSSLYVGCVLLDTDSVRFTRPSRTVSCIHTQVGWIAARHGLPIAQTSSSKAAISGFVTRYIAKASHPPCFQDSLQHHREPTRLWLCTVATYRLVIVSSQCHWCLINVIMYLSSGAVLARDGELEKCKQGSQRPSSWSISIGLGAEGISCLAIVPSTPWQHFNLPGRAVQSW